MPGDGLSDYELKWLGDVPNPADFDAAVDNSQDANQKREAVLADLIDGHIGKLKGEISKAQDVVLKQQSRVGALNDIWKHVVRHSDGKTTDIKWRASDSDFLHTAPRREVQTNWDTRQDAEFDTVGDGKRLVEVPPEQVAALQSSLDAILATQNEMLNSFDDQGNPLFSEKDIMDELWTPLVRDGTIPENMVPDKYSETAHAFDGACEIYNDKLKEFSANSHGKEDLLNVLSIVKDTVQLAGTAVVTSVNISNAAEIASKQEQITKGVDSGGKKLSDADKEGMRKDVSRMKNELKFANLANAIVNGGMDLTFDTVKEGVKSKDDRNWNKVIEKAATVTLSLIIQSVDPIVNEWMGHKHTANAKSWSKSADKELQDKGKEYLEKLKYIKSAKIALQGAVIGVKMAGTLHRAYEAHASGKSGLAESLLSELGSQIGDAVASALAATGNQMGGEAGAEVNQVGKAIAAAIKAGVKGPAILKALESGNTSGVATLLGAMAVQAGLSTASEAIFDAMHRDVSGDEYKTLDKHERAFAEKANDSQEKSQTTASADLIAAITKNMDKIAPKLLAQIDTMKVPELESPEEKALGLKIQRDVEENAKKKAQAELKKAFGDPKVVKEMITDFDTRTKDLEELYAAAYPDDALPSGPPDEVDKALQQIDRVIAQSKDLRQKVDLINAVTSAASSVLAAFVPGCGSVVAAQKVAFDLFKIAKCVMLHNNWCAGLEISFRSNSAYGPAIERSVKNARIELKQSSLEIILHTLQLGAEAAKFADPTAATTITSVSVSMADAVQKYAFKMHKQRMIIQGWLAYKAALKDPGNRKAARKALRLNSTLAKCCIAYGASIAKDPAAMETVRLSGLTVSALQDDRDVCHKLVAYLQEQMRNDPDEMRVQTEPAPWQPGRPKLTPASWFETKGAAARVAKPRLAPASAKTPALDRLMADLAGRDGFDGVDSYAERRDNIAGTGADDAAKALDQYQKRKAAAESADAILRDLKTALEGYAPVEDGAPGKPHDVMLDITGTLIALVKINLRQTEADITAQPPVPAAKSKPKPKTPSKKGRPKLQP